MTSISHLGHFPFCVKRLAEDGAPFEAWDGATYVFNSSNTSKRPSKTESSLVTVYGTHTPYPVGFTLAELMEIFWRCKRFDLSVDGSISVTSPAITANGGYYTGDPPVWVATSATVPSISLTASNVGPAYVQGDYTFDAFGGAGTEQPDPPKHKVCMGPFSGIKWNPYDSSNVYLPPPTLLALGLTFSFGESDTDSNTDSAEGSSASNSATVAIGLDMRLSLEDVIFAEDKYWPRFQSVNPNNKIFADVRRSSEARQPSGDWTNVSEIRIALYQISSYFNEGIPDGAEISRTIPFEITLSEGNTIAFPVGTWRQVYTAWAAPETEVDHPHDASLVPSMPTFKIVCTKWWEYGGIYDENTGQPT